jgi:hypothetical protein
MAVSTPYDPGLAPVLAQPLGDVFDHGAHFTAFRRAPGAKDAQERRTALRMIDVHQRKAALGCGIRSDGTAEIPSLLWLELQYGRYAYRQAMPMKLYLRVLSTFLRSASSNGGVEWEMRKLSSVLPASIATFNHSGFSPRPAHVLLGLSGLRDFGATSFRVSPNEFARELL